MKRGKRAVVIGIILLLALPPVLAAPISTIAVFSYIAGPLDLALKTLSEATLRIFNSIPGTPSGVESFGITYLGLLLGVLAFIAGTYTLWLYAAIEIFFGMYGAAIALMMLYTRDYLPEGFRQFADTPTRFPQFLALGTSIYVIVRGADNLKKWMEEKSGKKLV